MAYQIAPYFQWFSMTLSDLECRSPIAGRFFKWKFFIHFCSNWQHFNSRRASRGPSAIAELLVLISAVLYIWLIQRQVYAVYFSVQYIVVNYALIIFLSYLLYCDNKLYDCMLICLSVVCVYRRTSKYLKTTVRRSMNSSTSQRTPSLPWYVMWSKHLIKGRVAFLSTIAAANGLYQQPWSECYFISRVWRD